MSAYDQSYRRVRQTNPVIDFDAHHQLTRRPPPSRQSCCTAMQVYVGDRSGVLQMPSELRAFSKVHLEAGASQRIELPIARADLEHFHPDAGWVFAGGSM
jgi:beta-glucosidase